MMGGAGRKLELLMFVNSVSVIRGQIIRQTVKNGLKHNNYVIRR